MNYNNGNAAEDDGDDDDDDDEYSDDNDNNDYDEDDVSNENVQLPLFAGLYLWNFQAVSGVEVKSVLKNWPLKTYEIDRVPLTLLKDILDLALPFITANINSSLQSGIVSDSFKEAVMGTLLKKSWVEQQQFRKS